MKMTDLLLAELERCRDAPHAGADARRAFRLDRLEAAREISAPVPAIYGPSADEGRM